MAREASMLGPATFRFLNETGTLEDRQAWDDPARAKLWLYNLHYFDDLNARGAGERASWHRDLVERWVLENPPAGGNGWEPYPCSLRIVNWIKWSLSGAELAPRWTDSLATQVRWLEQHLEYHLLGNHLLANAKALFFAGLYFEGEEAERWLRRGEKLLNEEVGEQVLPDGGHFERSPMYHLIVLEDLLDLANLARAYAYGRARSWEDAAERMLSALPVMLHPDGEIAFFNDAATGIAPLPARVYDYAARLGFRAPGPHSALAALPRTGYFRLAAGPAVCIADVAPVGPDYLPGHAHADTLSFELSLDDQRVLVNSGTSVYGTGPERLRQRGTAAHNTVEVDGQDSSEVWSGFRVARRARPFDVDYGGGEDRVWLVGAHDGYRRLARSLVHKRYWALSARELSIHDQLGDGARHARARFHVHPRFSVAMISDQEARLDADGGPEVRIRVVGGILNMENATYHPAFGESIPNRVLVVNLSNRQCETRFSW